MLEYSSALNKYIYPFAERFSGTSISKHLKILNETQWYSRSALDELQNKKLRALIKHAYQNTAYYRKLFDSLSITPDDIQTKEDLEKLPVLTKEDVKRNFNEIKAGSSHHCKAYLNSSGGSSGSPQSYLIDYDTASIAWAGVYRGWSWADCAYGEKSITLAGSSLVPNKAVSMRQTLRNFIERNKPLSAVHLDSDVMRGYLDVIGKHKPSVIRGYPSALSHFGSFIKNNGGLTHKPKAVFTTSEMLLPHQKQIIEEAFNCPVYNHYGCYDGGAQALECSVRNGFHVTEEKVVLEVADSFGNPLPKGESGSIITTDLHNYAMPFIRYVNGDLGILSEDDCPCGRKLQLLKKLEGRTTDFIKLKNGKSIFGPAIILTFRDLPVKKYQLIGINGRSLLIKIVPDACYGQKHSEYIRNIVEHHTGKDTPLTIKLCDDIPNEANGKYKYILNTSVLP